MKNNSFSTVPSSSEGIEKQDLHVVGIGASAGGLEAIEQFFANMPSPNGMAFIIVQHLSSKYKSFMPELLAKNRNEYQTDTRRDDFTRRHNLFKSSPSLCDRCGSYSSPSSL